MYNNIKTLEQLLRLSERDVLRLKGVGRKTLNDIKQYLEKYGLRLADDVGCDENWTPEKKA